LLHCNKKKSGFVLQKPDFKTSLSGEKQAGMPA
jgi:hypothetical protein